MSRQATVRMLLEVPDEATAEGMEKLVAHITAKVNGTPARVIDIRWSSPGIRTEASASFYGTPPEAKGRVLLFRRRGDCE